jgi:hypothetical protein
MKRDKMEGKKVDIHLPQLMHPAGLLVKWGGGKRGRGRR